MTRGGKRSNKVKEGQDTTLFQPGSPLTDSLHDLEYVYAGLLIRKGDN